MKTKTINLYSFNELSKEAQEKAHKDWISNNDYPFLKDDMQYKCQELLDDNKITGELGNIYYSLSYCQGDGAMFEGKFKYKNHDFSVVHSGHYYHENSKTITDDTENDRDDGLYDDTVEKEFNDIYVKICWEMERYGYDVMRTDDSLENFKDTCEANDYTFLSTGKMENQ